jgi:hypothetical protein
MTEKQITERASRNPESVRVRAYTDKEKRNQAACCVEPHGWCVVASIGPKGHFGYDRAVLQIQATTVRISNGQKSLSLSVRRVKWT